MKKLILIDGHSIIHRTFYGIPDLTNSEGIHTNAIYGFVNILLKLIDEEAPDAIAVAFDMHAPTFRHEKYPEYKGTRKPMPEELREQVPLIKKVLRSMGVQIREQAGLEADDILGTLARQGESEGMEVSLVSGDRDLLKELIENLIQNAIQYNRENGSILVRTGQKEDHPFLSIQDTGIGIPKNQQERIFERFYRIDKSRSRETGGTGLGLAIVKHIAEIHGAEITVDSEPGKGTCVTVEF